MPEIIYLHQKTKNLSEFGNPAVCDTMWWKPFWMVFFFLFSYNCVMNLIFLKKTRTLAKIIRLRIKVLNQFVPSLIPQTRYYSEVAHVIHFIIWKFAVALILNVSRNRISFFINDFTPLFLWFFRDLIFIKDLSSMYYVSKEVGGWGWSITDVFWQGGWVGGWPNACTEKKVFCNFFLNLFLCGTFLMTIFFQTCSYLLEKNIYRWVGIRKCWRHV